MRVAIASFQQPAQHSPRLHGVCTEQLLYSGLCRMLATIKHFLTIANTFLTIANTSLRNSSRRRPMDSTCSVKRLAAMA
jgi:hypothetical protein